MHLVADPAHEVHHVGALARVHPGHRLVEHQQPGPGGQRPADLEPALLTVGEVAGVDVAPARQSDELEQLVGIVLRALLVLARRTGVEHRPHQVDFRWMCIPTGMFSMAVMFPNSRMFW